MPKYYSILDNGQEKGSGSQKAENKRFNRSRPPKGKDRSRRGYTRLADGKVYAGEYEAAWSRDRAMGPVNAKIRRQKNAAASAGLQKAKARGTNIDASYVGRTIYKGKQRKAKQGNKR